MLNYHQTQILPLHQIHQLINRLHKTYKSGHLTNNTKALFKNLDKLEKKSIKRLTNRKVYFQKENGKNLSNNLTNIT